MIYEYYQEGRNWEIDEISETQVTVKYLFSLVPRLVSEEKTAIN